MKLTTQNTRSLKSKTLGLALAAVLIPSGLAMAHDGGHRDNVRTADVRTDLSGHVEVVHQVPGGVITVGADWGKDHRRPVVAERREVVVERGYGRHHHREREVTVIREEPRRTVTLIRTEPPRPQVVVVEKRELQEVRDDGCNRDTMRDGNNRYYTDDREGRNRNVYVQK